VRSLELLTDLPRMTAIAGNTERYVVTDDHPPPTASEVIDRPELLDTYAAVQRSFAWTCGAIAAHGWLDRLGDLPPEHRTRLPDGTVVLGVHATPGRDDGARRRALRVAYDHDAFLETVARSGHPAADYIASFQRGE
jgi:hypothetical protein